MAGGTEFYWNKYRQKQAMPQVSPAFFLLFSWFHAPALVL
jgi:hypothetical protein